MKKDVTFAILVGSRGSEVSFLAEPFLKTALLLKEKYPDLQFLVPLVNENVVNNLRK